MRTALVLALVGCTSKESTPGETSDTDGLGASDTDTDTDTDTEEPAAPCPFAGSWTIAEVLCNDNVLDVTGTAGIGGSAEDCRLQFDATADGCDLTEHVELLALPFGLWEGYTDAAGEPECRYTETGPRALGLVDVDETPEGLTLSIDSNTEGHFWQIVGCFSDQVIRLVPGL